jgi:hypothetical protein
VLFHSELPPTTYQLPATDQEKRDINKRNERNRHQNKKPTAKNYPKIKKKEEKRTNRNTKNIGLAYEEFWVVRRLKRKNEEKGEGGET